jgi:hypothetical protein
LEEKYAHCITKIVLPTSDYNEVEAFLDIAGQSHFGLFPDLEGLREQLMAEMDQEISAVRDHLTGNPAMQLPFALKAHSSRLDAATSVC